MTKRQQQQPQHRPPNPALPPAIANLQAQIDQHLRFAVAMGEPVKMIRTASSAFSADLIAFVNSGDHTSERTASMKRQVAAMAKAVDLLDALIAKPANDAVN